MDPFGIVFMKKIANLLFSCYRIVGSLIALGKALGCYKISLNCSDAMVGYYGSLGFKHEEGNANFLQLRT